MDKRQIISAVSLSVLVFALWTVFELWYQKTHPAPPPTNTPALTSANTAQPTGPATAPASEPVVATTTPTAGPETAPTAPVASAPSSAPSLNVGLHAVGATTQPAEVVLLGSQAPHDPTYAMQVALTPSRAGIADVTLNDFFAPGSDRVKKSERQHYHFETAIADHPGTQPLASRTLVINDVPVDLINAQWTRVSSDAGSATYNVDVIDGAGPLAQITKTFRLPTRTESKAASQGYEVSVEQTIRSLRPGTTLHVRAIVNGPTPPPAEVDAGTDRTLLIGYDQAGRGIELAQHAFTEFKPGAENKDLTKKDEEHFSWAGEFSSYFAAIALVDPTQRSLFSVHGDALDPYAEVNRNVALTFETVVIDVTPDKPVTLSMSVFLGPKWRDVIGNSYYSAFPRMYDQVLIIKSGLCAFCTFSPLVKLLVWILGIFHFVFRDWGLAIICLVLMVRAALHPITKKSQVQMMKMGKLAPEVEKLKKKYADQPDVLNKEMMLLYKEQGGAILGCLPMFLQTPIWIALWWALQGTFELRQEPFLYGFTWIKDLARPDRLVDIAAIVGHPIPLLFGISLSAINILPIVMAVVTYVNQKYFMPMPPAATPEQEQQQKMQRGMSLLFPLMFYSMPSGLNLYYVTSMSIGILESKIIRDHIKEQEAAEKEGRVIVPAKATRGAKKRDGQSAKDETPEKPGMMARIMAAVHEAQMKAEEIRKDEQKRNPKKGR